ncbi:phosphatidate cytidylyltransferase [[Mycoplasma] falconis]|uniref:Phosphatidate cytidylyltransferase n=1 Tax=[Mycoplasma] falconis TaxID=92403 RepID=A0A501XAV9_9BACT|nr:phosphatidate cytidylyltransferase [[Mycoplasma] falconis]TPE57725.1 phosphatidate cytidylyltransferase [[Mycoplasma] falconis]
MKNVSLRAKSAAILFAIIIPFFFLTYFGGLTGKVVGVGFYLLFGAWATYEVIKWNKLNNFWNILIVIIGALLWVFPMQWYSIDNLALNNTPFWITENRGLSIEQTIAIIKLILIKPDFYTNQFALSLSIIFISISLIFLINAKKFDRDPVLFLKSYFITITSVLLIYLMSKLLFIYNVASLYYLFCILIIPIVCDTAAYFGGRLLGQKIIKRKFSPRISPNKTWEGAITGYLAGALFVFIALYLGKLTANPTFTFLNNWKQFTVAVILLPAISITGDLWFSFIKRIIHIKDFSKLIPGHGGLMDRFDAVCFVSIATSLILMI